jgi:hypothetical protein
MIWALIAVLILVAANIFLAIEVSSPKAEVAPSPSKSRPAAKVQPPTRQAGRPALPSTRIESRD